MRRDIKNQYGAVIGFSKEDKNRIEYYLLVGGMIGFWDKRTQRYIAMGKAGSGMKAQSDIGVGEVYRLSINANREYKKKEQGIGVKMKYILKQKIQGGYKKTEYEITAKALPKLIAHAKKVRAELFDETGNAIDLENDGKAQMLMAAIKDEWETIQSYEGAFSSFTPEEQAVIKDIIMEEKVHIGQLQSMLDNIGKEATEPISEGTEEGEEQLGKQTEFEEDEETLSLDSDINAKLASLKARRVLKRRASSSNYTSDYDYNYLITNLDRGSYSYLFKYIIKDAEYWIKNESSNTTEFMERVDRLIRYFCVKVYNGYTRGEFTREQMEELKEKAKAEGKAVKEYIGDLTIGKADTKQFAMVNAASKRMKADIRRTGDDLDYITLFVNGKKFPNRIKETLRHEYRFKTSKGTWLGNTANEVVSKILTDDYGIIGEVEEAWVWESMGNATWAVKTDVNSNRKAVETSKKRVKCSIGEIIEQEILSEETAKEAYALGFRDAIEKADEVERENEEPNLDMEMTVEFDEDDPDSAEQAIYDAGVAEVEEYSDENQEFDDDVFEDEEDDEDE